MKQRLATALSLLALASFARHAHAQIVIVGPDGQSIVMDGGDEAPQPAPDVASSTDAAKKDAKPSARLEKLKKLEYDRRASAVLEAWSKPPKPKDEKPAEKAAAPAPDAAKPATDAAPAPSADAGAKPAADAAAKPAEADVKPADAAPEDPEAAKKKADEEKKKAEEAAKKQKAEEEAAKKAAEAKAIDEEMAALQRNVTLGDWEAVRTYFATLTDDERKGGFEQMLKSLQKGNPKKPQVPPQGQPYLEKNAFAPADVLALTTLSAKDLTKENIALLGQILKQALDQGHRVEGFIALAKPVLVEKPAAEATPPVEAAPPAEATPPADAAPSTESKPSQAPAPADASVGLDRRKLAQMLVAASQPLEIAELLPTLAEAESSSDREALNLLSRHFLAKNDKEAKVEWLEKAWRATQAVLAIGEVSEEAKNEALARAVELAPKIQKELGQAWLSSSFTERPERGMEILASIGAQAATALQSLPTDAERRFKMLELQTTAAKALLEAAPQRADEWRAHLSLLAGNWLREAIVTYQMDRSTTLGPQVQRDVYGNFFWWDENGGMMQGNNGQLKPLTTRQVLDVRPTDAWLARVEETQLPRYRMAFAQLFLKVGEEGDAFPYIESLATTHPRPAKDLSDEFLRVWAKNHDPNGNRNRQNRYIYFYGFEERANSIPLTRSKQERNLKELGEWVARLKKLGVEIEPDLVAAAFRTAHSAAEVYRLETIEDIFGPMESLEPALIGRLLESMRVSLATVWRDAALQKDKKTNRGQQDIQAEVLRGYELANATLSKAIEKQPDAWQLALAKAAFEHDQNAYQKQLSKDPSYSERRAEAFAQFASAADLYAKALPALEREKESCDPFLTWFYAALGACDLGAIDETTILAPAEIPKIKAALESLPVPRAERHMETFVNALATRMGSAKPAVKFRYVREGLAICGDHKLAREVRDLYGYYKDLVTEIQLAARVDGDTRVGHGEPFGLAVDIVHTKEIERESGGFAKYLQNQNNMGFSFNYGRPTEDYRDKFEEAARTALKEHFDVVSVTFNDPQARSKATTRYGWRVTPYAYVLLKPRGPEIDKVPALKLDLDFLDTSGYAVLPIESPPVAIDAKGDAGAERPFDKLTLVQTLDERQAKDGKLILEIKATANGLVPPLASIADVAPEGFDVVKHDDHGVSIVKFADDASSVLSERTWSLTLRAKEGLAELPTTFAFATPKLETLTSERFRYVDADLQSVDPVVSLERSYGRTRGTWGWWLAGAVAIVAAAAWLLRRKRVETRAITPRFAMPAAVTPFSVLGLLRDIEQNNGLAPDAKRALGDDIATIERHFFGGENGATPDLHGVARSWVSRTS